MSRSLPRGLKALPTCGLAALLALACVKQTVEPVASSAGSNGIAPQLVIEQFLRASNCVASETCDDSRQSLEALGRLFGTADGPIATQLPAKEVERRMALIATILRHQDYSIRGQNLVPGHENQVRLLVNLKRENGDVEVPFTLVRAHGGGWLITNIDLSAVTSRP